MMKDIMMNQLGTRTQALLSIIVGWIAVVAVSVSPLSAEQIRNETESQPWWDQEKIRFFWGCWYHLPNAGVPMEEVMKNLSQIGATVFVERHWLNLDHARLARKYGIRYFGVLSAGPGGIAVQQTSWLPARFKKELDVRWWVNEKGITHMGKDPKYPCPLCKPVYEAWFLAPVLEAAESGLVDGMHMDWEAYADWVELPGKKPGPCYCDDCFGQFLSRKTQRADLPKSERYKWLEAQGQVKEYREVFDQRREQMYRGFAQRIRQVKPQFLFSMYHGRVTPLSRGLHTDDVPVLIVDPSHYYDHHTRPWWEIPRSYHRKHGMRHIGGSWDNSLFGGQPESGISASQWMYEVAVNMDGYWMWFEQELTPSDWRAFWIANRRIGATEAKVGKFLLAGKQDLHFVTPVEWSGNPAFERRIILRTYHLEDEHLVHVNNVDLDLPIQVRLRFPRLSENTRWTVRDPMSDLAYVHDGDRRLWSAQQLARGMTISLEKRSELFLRLSPEGRDRGQKTAGVITSQEISPMPDHPEGERQDPEDRTPTGRERLAYLKTESLGFLGNHCREIGNAIHAMDADGKNPRRLRQLKGYLWSPAWSPDGTRIAFCHYANGRGQIYVMNADGTGDLNLSRNSYCDRSPVWSPDGATIAFVSDRDGDWEIYAMDREGGRQRRLTESAGVDRAPVWSPDGRSLAFESEREGDLDIFVMNADGTGCRPVIKQPGHDQKPTWSPDGSRIACVGVPQAGWSRSLLVARADGPEMSPPRSVTGMLFLDCVCWSPDGKRLAAVYHGPTHGGALTGILTINADGTDQRKLVQVSAMKPYPSEGPKGPTWYSMGSASPRWVVKTMGGLCWSPDGTRLAFSSDMSEDGYFYVYTVSTEGGEPTRLEETVSAWLQQLAWCPQ